MVAALETASAKRAEAARLRMQAALPRFSAGGAQPHIGPQLIAKAKTLEAEAAALEGSVRLTTMPVRTSGPVKFVQPALPVDAKLTINKPSAEAANEKRRTTLINTYRNKQAFKGSVKIGGEVIQVVGGAFDFDGGKYALSKDGRAVMDRRTLLLVGEVVGGVMRSPSAAFVKEMSILGGVV